MISDWLSRFLGSVGTGALLLVVGASYLIWQFNPTFKWPERAQKLVPLPATAVEDPFLSEPSNDDLEEEDGARLFITPSIAEAAAAELAERPNMLKGEGGMQFTPSINDQYSGVPFEVIEREETPADEEPEEESIEEELPQEKEIIADILHSHDLDCCRKKKK
jgi:S-DNA-T family DNA segregation ATPase FtsK/SpoIIIE